MATRNGNGAEHDRPMPNEHVNAAQDAAATPLFLLATLIVDDDEGVRFFLRNYLESLGVTHILEATNGQEAVEVVKRRTDLGLVITDLKMPKMDGVEMVQQIHALNPTLPVVVLTAYPDYPRIVETAKRGALFVMKPIELQALDQIVGGILKHPPMSFHM